MRKLPSARLRKELTNVIVPEEDAAAEVRRRRPKYRQRPRARGKAGLRINVFMTLGLWDFGFCQGSNLGTNLGK